MKKFRKPLPLLEKVKILDAGSEGKAIARVGDLVVFVPFVIPGDIVDIQVIKKKKSFLEGKAIHFHEYSPLRIDAFCEHFGLCGGCRWQNMRYSDQLFFKHKQVVDAFERIGKIDFKRVEPIIPSPLETFYRNKLEYTFSDRRWLNKEEMEESPDMRGLGFHLPLMFDRVIDIRSCSLQPPPSDDIRLKTKELCLQSGLEFYNARQNRGFFRNLVIRDSSKGDVMIILVVSREQQEIVFPVLDELERCFPQITSLFYAVNEKQNDSLSDLDMILYKGKGYLEECLGPLNFRIGPKSFFQVNTAQALQMYGKVLETLELSGREVIYDLYTGTGTIANFVAGSARKVIGIEYVEAAVEDALINSKVNNIDNTLFFSGDIAKVLDASFVEEHGKPDVIITDPPRAGMNEKVIQQIVNIQPEKIVYISCNPATQARDLALLSACYTVERVQPFDMFPHTQHVECLVFLKKRPD